MLSTFEICEETRQEGERQKTRLASRARSRRHLNVQPLAANHKSIPPRSSAPETDSCHANLIVDRNPSQVGGQRGDNIINAVE